MKLDTSTMDVSNFKKFLQNIEDYVFIEEKIVTSIWLCQALKVHVNTAKQLLHAFLQEDDFKDKVSVTYLLGGELKNGGGVQLKLVNQNERDKARNLFLRITSDHVFSIQKLPNPPEALTDIFNAFPHFNIEDRSLSCVKLTKDIERREIKLNCADQNKESPAPASGKTASKEAKAAPKETTPTQKDSKSSPKESKISTKDGSKDTKSDIKAVEKIKENGDSKPPPSKQKKLSHDTHKGKAEKSKAGGIGNFFQKQTPNNNQTAKRTEIVKEKQPTKETNRPTEDHKNKMDVDKKKSDEKVSSINGKEGTSNSSAKGNKMNGKENRNKRKKRDEREDESRKKRKRIAAVFSSDSESSDNEKSEAEEMMETEELPPVQATNGRLEKEEEEDIIPPTPGRKRVRKAITKTFQDDDGFFLTKKEYVYESCTDDEGAESGTKEAKSDLSKTPEVKKSADEPKKTAETPKTPEEPKKSTKTNEKKNSPKKKKTPANDKSNNKQASIMSFFKKK